MQYYESRPQVRFGFGGGDITPAVKGLMIANGVVFLIQLLFGDRIIMIFGLHPSLVFRYFLLYQFVSYMFLHGGFWHIFINMLMLWMFGCEVERKWGSKEFLKFYFITGIGAGFFHLLFQSAAVVGASGAIYGVLIAFVMLFPNRQLWLFPFPVSMKAKHWAIILVAMSILLGLFSAGNYAHFAHLGGMLVGFIYVKFGWRLFISDFVYKKKMEIKLRQNVKKKRHVLKLKKEVDQILDKINDVGYENLTEQEIATLKEASEILSKQSDDLEN
ncbi:hypothetical protein B6I21_03965 [candidate division KSB1 bacterium 4572_119]|nr:MAG: hypothetical protein B6I21_03965 [candidate division KSB1 bacterium 4572_119]